MNLTELPWRVGRKTRRTIYAILPGVEYDKHPLLGMMDTDILAAEVVSAHNETLDHLTFIQKEQLIKDLEDVREIMLKDSTIKLEDAILLITADKGRSERVYSTYGASAEMLQDMSVAKVVPHAIKLVRQQ